MQIRDLELQLDSKDRECAALERKAEERRKGQLVRVHARACGWLHQTPCGVLPEIDRFSRVVNPT